MSEGSRRSRVTITLGRSGQVVNRDASDIDAGYELPRVGTKRSAKERLGNQLDSSLYGGSEEVVSKRQRGEASLSGNDLQISQNDLRFKLLQKNAQRQAQSNEGSTMDLREKLSRSEQPPRSLDTRPRMAEPRDVPLPSSRTARGSSQMISSSSSYAPWALEDLRQRSPERFVDTSRGPSPPRNDGRMIGIPRAPSPPRNAGRIIGSPRDRSPPRNAGRIGSPRGRSPLRNAGRIGSPRDRSPPRNAGRIGSPRYRSPPRNAGRIGSPRDRSPPRNAGRIGSPRYRSPPRNARRIGSPRDRSPPRNAGRRIDSPRDLSSPPRSTRSFSSASRALSPARNVGSYMGSSLGFSPPRNPRSYMGSSRGSPPRSNIEDFHGRSRMLDDVRAPYPVRGVLNGQAPTSGAPFARPMLPPPVPNPHPLPPLSQLPPFGSMMQNNPFSVEEPLTVDSFLNSIGLGKYSLAFKREEVDMTTIKQMKESDLKDLIIPMGPRKKILQAIASLPTR
ncbi:PREDICTED: serine/arginine repetitive matrix protein 1 [Camelina sativa]|uniref:Serine/arginine repetitive matrix protein 1 n=1 Tax=Camelina sativa TaxID=90675 RepID=A0ABM0Z8Y3_CAMSA|nr:PREDICTED: serine/arginine repetitive matrix protein 1 [Camelina sativa]